MTFLYSYALKMAQDQSSMEDKDDPTKVLERTLCQLEKLTLKNEQIAANLVPNKRENSEIVQCPPSCSRILSFSLKYVTNFAFY
jgi:hypothetical protein